MLTISEIRDIYEMGKEIAPKVVNWFKDHIGRSSSENYQGMFEIEDYKIPYISLLNEWTSEIEEYTPDRVSHHFLEKKFKLPKDLEVFDVPHGAFDGRRCRLAHFEVSNSDSLSFTFQETSYYDYLRSGEYLDSPYPSRPEMTNRDAFGRIVQEYKGHIWPFEHLTNICGVGVYVISSDNHVVLSKHSRQSHIYPGRYTFSSSGTMQWDRPLSPFHQIGEVCLRELGHRMDIEKSSLIGFGADARKLYFQFSFVEQSDLSLNDILANYAANTNATRNKRKLIGVKLDQESLIEKIIENCWEPAAEAAMLTMLGQRFDKKLISQEIFSRKSLWRKRTMIDEWDYRASKAGLLPVMSVRYPQKELEKLSYEYTRQFMAFVGDDINGATVVEVGSGIGRITKHLAKRANRVVCLEISERMISRSNENLSKVKNVTHIPMFAQDYRSPTKFDAAICSLVLMHNVNEKEYEKLIENICDISERVYLAEDVTENRPTSPFTKIRGAEEISKIFGKYGFSSEKEELYTLENDKIAFIKFSPKVQ